MLSMRMSKGLGAYLYFYSVLSLQTVIILSCWWWCLSPCPLKNLVLNLSLQFPVHTTLLFLSISSESALKGSPAASDGNTLLPLQPKHNGPPSPLFHPSSPSPRCTHQSCVHRVGSHNSIRYQPRSSTLTNSQLPNVIGSTLERLLSSLCPFAFLLRLRGIWSLHSTMLNVKIPREITFGFASSGQVVLGVTIQYTQSDKQVSI